MVVGVGVRTVVPGWVWLVSKQIALSSSCHLTSDTPTQNVAGVQITECSGVDGGLVLIEVDTACYVMSDGKSYAFIMCVLKCDL